MTANTVGMWPKMMIEIKNAICGQLQIAHKGKALKLIFFEVLARI
jgi:hypothetical protein